MDKCGLSDLDKKWRDNENVILIFGKIQGGSSENMCVGNIKFKRFHYLKPFVVGKRVEPCFEEEGTVYWY